MAEDRDRFVAGGMSVCAAGAAVASADALRSLAAATGWSTWSSWLLPLSVDSLAAVAVRVWLDTGAPPVARQYGRLVAVAAVLVSMAGNAASHLVGTDVLSAGWPLVVLVGATPAAALGAVAHLHALRTVPVPRRTRRRYADSSAGRVATDANGGSDTSSGASRSRPATSRESSPGGRVTAAKFTDRAVAAWRPGVEVTAAWIQRTAGCGRTVAYRIAPAVRERVAGRKSGDVVVEFTNRDETG